MWWQVELLWSNFLSLGLGISCDFNYGHLEQFPLFILRLVIAMKMFFCALESLKLFDQIHRKLLYCLYISSCTRSCFPVYKNISFLLRFGFITHYLKKFPKFERNLHVAMYPIMQWCTVRRFKPSQDKITTLTQ